MIRRWFAINSFWILAVIFGFSGFSFQNDPREKITRQYFAHLNASQIEQAKALTDTAFIFENFEGRKKSRTAYFEEFQRKLELHPITEIIECIIHENYLEVWGSNSSDYNIYLDFDALPIKYNVSFKNGKIQHIYFDSLPGYGEKRKALQTKTLEFQHWIERNHPEYAAEYQRNGYMKEAPQLLKEYTRQKK